MARVVAAGSNTETTTADSAQEIPTVNLGGIPRLFGERNPVTGRRYRKYRLKHASVVALLRSRTFGESLSIQSTLLITLTSSRQGL